ncbi:DNA polymerase III subunit alpha [Aerococcaceae bacterium NML171108]|nr:DNA polymerase III subunit alpha [Aerococcaceae bacterium NML171108]
MLLNVRSAYSLLQSTIRIEHYVIKAKELGYQAIGLADEKVLHGALEFYNTCRRHGLKPLIGLTVKLPGIVRQDKEFPFLLYAINAQGYQHLMRVSRMLNSDRYVKRDVWQYLRDKADNLIIVSIGRKGELEQALIHEDEVWAQTTLQEWQKIFGDENVYIGVPIYPMNAMEVECLVTFAHQQGVPTVINQLLHTLNREDGFSLKVLKAIHANESVDLSLQNIQGAHYLYAYSQLVSMYEAEGLMECVTATQQLVARLNVEIAQHQTLLPSFPTPNGASASNYLRQVAMQALTQLGLQTNSTYIERLNYELSVIDRMGFSDYFLIVWEIMDYCHRNQIRTGPGRGSAAGSLVSFLLKITLVDPIEYELLFERFLNPERQTMPDIDIDIPDNQREKVLRYIEQRYGHEQVAQIATFGTFGAKQAIRDTLRVLGATTDTLKRWARAIPNELNISLEQAYRQSSTLRQLVEASEDNRHFFKVALTLEGLPRHVSTHAAAVVISDQPLQQLIPVMERQEQRLMTQFTMYDIEQIGLLKMDFLGLRNLTLLEDIIRNVKKGKPQFDIKEINLDDETTLDLFRRADTFGIFQFESEGIKNVLRKVQPASFEDIVAVNALFRPGPMKQIDTFVARKHGKLKPEYFHEMLVPILAKTYGVMVYQEQVMQVCQLMAGFTLGQADLLRRAMSKKQADVMERERQYFIEGATKRGITAQLANQVYQHIQEFASYGFNRSHAVVYSTLAYQLAYLKAHYPLAFYQALLNNGRSAATSFAHYFQEAKRQLGHIRAVNINLSQAGFSVQKGQLMVGFESIKGMRREWIDYILNDRQLVGPYTSLINFLQRMPKKFLKQEAVEALIYAGAFDSFGYNRATLTHNLPHLLKGIEFSGNNLNLFPALEPKIEWVDEWDLMTVLAKEKEVLDFVLSGHPLDEFERLFDMHSDLTRLEHLPTLRKKTSMRTIGMITHVKQIRTKKNDRMAFVTLSNETFDATVVVFPQVYQQHVALLKENTILYVEGTVDLDNRGETQLIANRIQDIHQTEFRQAEVPQTCFIKVADFEQAGEKVQQLKTYIQANPGPAKVILVDNQRRTWQLDNAYQVSYAPRIQQELKQMFGIGNVVFK